MKLFSFFVFVWIKNSSFSPYGTARIDIVPAFLNYTSIIWLRILLSFFSFFHALLDSISCIY